MFRCQYCGAKSVVDPGKCLACTVGVFEPVCTFPAPLPVGDPFLDTILGGYRPASVLLSGPPGSGKSTLAGQWAKLHPASVYATTEEHLDPVTARLQRLKGPFAPRVVSDPLIAARDIRSRGALVVDSIGGLGVTDYSEQLRDVQRLVAVARGKELTLFLLAHVNRRGDVAGIRSIEHAVDAVVMLDPDAGTVLTKKTRFGPQPAPIPYVVTKTGVVRGGSKTVVKTGPGWVRTMDRESRETTLVVARSDRSLRHNIDAAVVNRVLLALAPSEFAIDDHLIVEASTPVDDRAGLALAVALASLSVNTAPPRGTVAGEVMAVGHVVASRDPRVVSHDGHVLDFLRQNIGKPRFARGKSRRKVAA